MHDIISRVGMWNVVKSSSVQLGQLMLVNRTVEGYLTAL